MTYTAVPTKSSGDPLTSALWNTYLRDNLNKGVLRPIAATQLGAPASSIALSSIAADWTNLLLAVFARGTAVAASTALNLRVNGDTGANYDTEYLPVAGAAAVAASEEFGAVIFRAGLIPCASAPANAYGATLIDVLDYNAGVVERVFHSTSACKTATTSGGMHMERNIGYWRGTAAITSLTLWLGAGNFETASKVVLYGMGST